MRGKNPKPAPSRLRCGYVAVVGRTNVGKSTLLNSLLKRKVSIVSDKPQTTRRRILGVLTEARGQAVFFDTPGVHKPGHELNRRMVQYIHDALQTADLLLHVIDAGQSFGHGEQFVMDLVAGSGKPAILALNKIDLVGKGKLLAIIDFYRQKHAYASYVPVCALSGDGAEPLLAEIFQGLPEGDLFYEEGFVTDVSDRFMTMELVREKLLANVRDEMPFTTAVVIDLFDDSGRRENGLLHVDASIVVERDSQKGIVIGARGSRLKAIGTAARLEMEKMLGCRVYLHLNVKVEPDWRNDPRFLNDLETVR